MRLPSRLIAGLGLALAGAATAAATGSAAEPATASALSPEAECLARKTMHIGGGVIAIDDEPTRFALGAAPVCRWIALAATAVVSYYGRYPVHSVHLKLETVDGDGVQGGTTYGDDDGDSLIVIPFGRDTRQSQLDRDWVITHEMVHLSVPSVPRESHWLEEGIATYVEPIARVQLGQLDEQQVWADMLQGMPKGLPKSGDRGLDRTPTWGRTYWGGGLFCLLADVEIRERTHNRMSLRDALRGVQAAGGSIEKNWSVEQVLAAGDQATGVDVLLPLYRQMSREPVPRELDSLWKRLGVSQDRDGVHFDPQAPLAEVRAAITARLMP